MGMAWGSGDVLTVRVDLAACDVRFFRNGRQAPPPPPVLTGHVSSFPPY